MGAEALVKNLGHDCGFGLVRIGPASEMHRERTRYLQWIADGRHGEMRWIDRRWALKASAPHSAIPDARSVISVGFPYWHGFRPKGDPTRGKIARYAWGQDYHRVLGERMQRYATRLNDELGGRHHWYVDTGPAMDKGLAARSGLGWYGKNTNILTEQFGSFVLLGEIITSLALEPDSPLGKDCGSCRLCLLACPTRALGPEYSIDSRKCISYLTIEHRGSIPVELRSAMGAWVFGCDICQDVCPPTMRPYLRDPEERRAWAEEVRGYIAGVPSNTVSAAPVENGDAPVTSENPLFVHGTRPDVDLVWLLRLSHEKYLEAFRGTAIRRAKVWMLRRNAAVALGNVGEAWAIEPLRRALTKDDHPMVRGHAAWALGRIAERLELTALRDVLTVALSVERDPEVRRELEMAAG